MQPESASRLAITTAQIHLVLITSNRLCFVISFSPRSSAIAAEQVVVLPH